MSCPQSASSTSAESTAICQHTATLLFSYFLVFASITAAIVSAVRRFKVENCHSVLCNPLACRALVRYSLLINISTSLIDYIYIFMVLKCSEFNIGMISDFEFLQLNLIFL